MTDRAGITGRLAMLIKPAVVEADVQRPSHVRPHATLGDYWVLTKPEVNFLIAITTAAAFYLAYPTISHPFQFLLFINTVLGTLMVASGTAALNQFVERRFDAQMRRTARRPLPTGRLEPSAALLFGIFLSLAGEIYLAVSVNTFASLLAGLTLVTYLFLYTPLKRKTPLCVAVGALSGAMPPLIGWAAASNSLSLEAWVLYAVLFFWQFPHVMAIAWIYREDYARAGYMVLPAGKRGGQLMAWQIAIPALVLILLSLAPILLGHAGFVYVIGAVILGLCFLYLGAQLVRRKSNAAARRLLFASIIYLPLVFSLLILDRS